MLSPITNDEIEFCECFYDCTAMTECLIPENLNIPQMWPKCKTVTIRDYQFAMQNYSYMIADDPELSIEENFKLKKASGDLYSIGARNLGKSFFLIIDVILSFIHNCKEGCVASVSSEKLVKVTNPICKFIEAHKFLKIFHLKKETTRAQTVKRDPLTLNGEHGAIILNVNEKAGEDNPGVQFQGKHYDIRWSEEYSYSTKEGQEQAEDAEMSYGHIERPSGIPDLHVDSPLGKILNDKKMKQWLWKLPQMVRQDWSDELEEKKAKFYNGKNTPAYKLNVEAKTLEGAFNFFDMARLKDASYYKTGRIKSFEVGKESYEGFENLIHVEKLSGSEQCYICADIGTGSAPTEIIITFYDGKHYKYTYNISLHRLLQHEQAEIFYWLFEQVGGAFIAVDSSVHPDEFVFLRIDGSLKYIRFKDVEQYKKCLLEVPTFNNDLLEWKKATLFSHNYNGKMANITLSPGNVSMKITDNHSAMVYDKNGLSKKLIKDCKIGDWMICPKNYHLEINNYKTLQYKNRKKNKYTKDEYIDILLDEDLAYFLGWCCAEGSSKTTSYQLSLGNEEKEAKRLLSLSKKIFKLNSGYIFENTKESQNKNIIKIKNRRTKATNSTFNLILGGGKGVLEFIEELVGKGAHNKKIPEPIFNSPDTVKHKFIQGLVHGDGNTRLSSKNEQTKIDVSSEELVKGLNCLLNTLNIHGCYEQYIRDGLYSYRLSWQFNFNETSWFGVPHELIGIPDKHNRIKSKTTSEKIVKRHTSDKNILEKFKKLYNGDWCFKKIKNIEYEDYQGIVYDMEVKDNHTFVTGNGNILVHNTHDQGVIIEYLKNKGIEDDYLLKVFFNENIEVDFERDKDGEIVLDGNNDPIMIKANTETWSFSELEKIFYDGEYKMPPDAKFEDQFSNVFCKRTKTRTLYDSRGPNHLVQAFQVFGICRFFNRFNILKQQHTKVKRAWCA